MSIRADSKKILEYAMSQALELRDIYDNREISPIALTKELGFPNEGYLRICCQYLSGKGLLKYNRYDDPDDALHIVLSITPAGIDALETDGV